MTSPTTWAERTVVKDAPAIMDAADEEIPREVLEERYEQRQARRRMNHWCDVCHGHTGPNSPCYDGPEEEPEDEGDFCGGCNPEPTMEETDSGVCASCGKEIA